VDVGDRPELLENEAPADRQNGGKRARRSKKAASKRRAVADIELPVDGDERPSELVKERRASRERSLNRLLAGLRAVNAGDFSVRILANGDPLMADIIEVFNSVAQKQAQLVDELSRVSLSVGREGKMRERVAMSGVGGQWMTAVESINGLIADLVQPTSEVSLVIKAVAEGDLSQQVELEIDGKQWQG